MIVLDHHTVRTVTSINVPSHVITEELATVVTVFANPTLKVDRPQIASWSVGPTSERTAKLAARLVQAILDGDAFGPATIATDTNGQTYIAATSVIGGRRSMSADLTRLGF